MSADILNVRANEQMRVHYEAHVIIFADVSPLQTVNTCLLTHLFWPPHMLKFTFMTSDFLLMKCIWFFSSASFHTGVWWKHKLEGCFKCIFLWCGGEKGNIQRLSIFWHFLQTFLGKNKWVPTLKIWRKTQLSFGFPKVISALPDFWRISSPHMLITSSKSRFNMALLNYTNFLTQKASNIFIYF